MRLLSCKPKQMAQVHITDHDTVLTAQKHGTAFWSDFQYVIIGTYTISHANLDLL